MGKYDYREMMNEIQPPPGLKERTRARMAGQSARPAPHHTARRALAVAAMLAVVVGAVALFGPGRDPLILTELTPGVHTEVVELRDGRLEFAPATGDPASMGPVLGAPQSARESWTAERFREETGAATALPYLPEGFALADASATAFYGADLALKDAHCTTQYQGPGGAVIRVTASMSAIPLPAGMSAPANSTIGDAALATAYNAPEDTYYAAFQLADIRYLLTFVHVEQEEVIQLLANFFSENAT